jgi:hypothetical protein
MMDAHRCNICGKMFVEVKSVEVQHFFYQGCRRRVARWCIFNLGKFWRVLQWAMLLNLLSISSNLLSYGLLYCHLVYFIAIWYIFPILVCCAKKNLATLNASTRIF